MVKRLVCKSGFIGERERKRDRGACIRESWKVGQGGWQREYVGWEKEREREREKGTEGGQRGKREEGERKGVSRNN